MGYFKQCFAAIFCLLGGLWAGEPTFYVATDGDNGAAGTLADPWATIDFALSQVPDGALILVGPGVYSGRIRLDESFQTGVVVRSAQPYGAQLRHNDTVLTCFTCQGLTLEGFDIAHDGAGAGALVIQIQDLIGDPGGPEATGRVVLRNNIIHDSFNNDLLKINNGARDVLVEGNLFYNQEGSDEHIDINGVVDVRVRDNIFFNDFSGSGRPNNNNTSSFIVIKNSGGHALNEQFLVERNIFLNWEGSSGSNFLLIGEDGQPFHEARDVLIQNNLMLGNANNTMRAAFGVKGGREVVFRNNTLAGDLPSLAFAMRLNREGANPANEEIHFFNNIWSDPTGSMGASSGGQNDDFSDTSPADTVSFELNNNLYWNGGDPIPDDPSELINVSDDAAAVVGDPQLNPLAGLVLPRWESANGQFLSGNATIREEFVRLASQYGSFPVIGSAVDVADPANAANDDILGRVRGTDPDIGAWESNPCVLVADLDGDLDVDLQDLHLLAVQWLAQAGAPFDLNGDGLIDILDLVLVANGFGDCSAI